MNPITESNDRMAYADERVIEWLAANVEGLHGQARMLVDDYWRRVSQERKKYPASQRGRLGVRIRRRESAYSFTIEWFLIASLSIDGQNKPVTQYLKKGKGYRYPLQQVLKKEPDWEAALVEEFENEFADLRKQVDLLGKFRDAFHRCRRGLREGLD
ncbi:conjugative transfer protein MobI(A/C) [Methylomonas rapida]|uniref:Conjugative transfer protein MobI(A/C) n=1 Tax=Methylomonas rapida TaxID=2963939 RepID=A0ABY7GK13_9GAMM|nr:conjugative transfer protein MobI(A/C) [Methylomonas rapida]WAR43273.1 conjugative transfer protein MobI(A/C) [Methylomonas rapida]